MSKIYEALRKHDRSPWVVPVPEEQETPPTSVPVAADSGAFGPNREMQALYRSVEGLTAAAVQGGPMIMFSSAHPGEGKTTVCGSFAMTLAQHFGKSVLILDGDQRHQLSKHWGTHKDASLAALEKRSPEAIAQASRPVGVGGSIAVIPFVSLAGLDHGSSELGILASAKERLSRTFDYVLIDAPALSDVAWSAAIGALADGVILVIQAERTRWPVALNSRQELESSGARVLGVFLNRRRFYIPPRIYRRI
jgi:protein-tyrosine kinase